MFTGLIQAIGRVVEVRQRQAAEGGGARIAVDVGDWSYAAGIGDSVAVNGCCLTVAAIPPGEQGQGGKVLEFDAVAETLAKTTLGQLVYGSRLNLERSLAAADLMGGHMVQGHVEGVGEVVHVERGGNYRMTIRPPRDLMPTIVSKGSITVDGVSLTVAGLGSSGPAGSAGKPPETFTVALIPTTLELTTLADLGEGSRVNLETDVIARTVVHWLEHFGRR